MKNIEYDNSFPLARLEKGDKARIRVMKIGMADKNKEKYKDVPEGVYDAICIEEYCLKCEEYPILSGRYTFWYGNKWGCPGVYGDEYKEIKK